MGTKRFAGERPGVGARWAAVMVIAVCVLLGAAIPAATGAAPAGAGNMEALLPPPGFTDGWVAEGKAETFSPDTLYTHINGEAELYMPYGFQALAFRLYSSAKDNKCAIAVDIYRMGSPLDTFGIYSNYRSPEAEPLKTGAGGFITDTQLMFYQDRYFIQISASGTVTPERKVFEACARAISGKLPKGEAPEELKLLQSSRITPRTEKYIAESVLGYVFFKRGLTAEATFEGKPVKVFVILNDSPAAATASLDGYTAYLRKAGIEPKITKTGETITLTTRDPLYKGLILRQSGKYLFGASSLDNPEKGIALIEGLSTPANR